MKGKTVRVKRRVRDYAMIAAIVAIFLSVAVMFGIAYSYPSESEKHQLALAISPQAGRFRPDPSQDVPQGPRLLPSEAYRRSRIGAGNRTLV